MKQFSSRLNENYTIFTNDRTNHIIASYKRLESNIEEYVYHLVNYFEEEADISSNNNTIHKNAIYCLPYYDKIKEIINSLMLKSVER